MHGLPVPCTIPRMDTNDTTPPPEQKPHIIEVRFDAGATRCYHSFCYEKEFNHGSEPGTDFTVRKPHNRWHCGHCASCGWRLWEPTTTCLRHDSEPCPAHDWWQTIRVREFILEWTVGHGWELCNDTYDAVDIIMREDNPPRRIIDLVARTRHILDVTA